MSRFKFPLFFLVLQGVAIGAGLSAFAARVTQYVPEFPPCSPVSEPSLDLPGEVGQDNGGQPPELGFCSKWNPEFAFNGHHCCAKRVKYSRKKRRMSCSLQRAKGTYCGEITPEQEEYTQLAESGQLGDVLELIERDLGQRGNQAYCTVNNGFLAWGRRLIPSEVNRISLRSPDRCTEFGTDSMVGMLEWVGRQVVKDYPAPDYSRTRLVIGDISAPRGGCLSGRGGRRGHLSHTTGQDVDVSFLVAKAGKDSPVSLHREFDAKQNWYLLKQFFKNPFGCIKVVFVDKRLIKKLAKVARGDEDWNAYHRFIRHMPGHRNHFHIRIGEGPGAPGCVPNAQPELEIEDGGEDVDLGFLDETTGLSRGELRLDGGDGTVLSPPRIPAGSTGPTRTAGQSVDVEE